MNRKIIAIILELIPVISAPISYALVISSSDAAPVRRIISIIFLLAFLGFAFFFIGRRLAKEDRTVRILAIIDWLATIYVIAFYILAIFRFGL